MGAEPPPEEQTQPQTDGGARVLGGTHARTHIHTHTYIHTNTHALVDLVTRLNINIAAIAIFLRFYLPDFKTDTHHVAV